MIFDATEEQSAATRLLPYGAVTSTGSLVQPVQWSTARCATKVLLVYYNYRFYNPKDGRWINRPMLKRKNCGYMRSSGTALKISLMLWG